MYFAADDVEARSKSFAAFGNGRGGIGLEVCHFPGADPAAVYEPGYDVLIGLFQGDWITVAARYRAWALQQPCLANFLPEHLVECRTDLAYLRQLVQLRQAALPYLLHGTFLRPPRMNITEMEIDVSRLSIYAGQQGAVQEYRKRVPQYLAGAWRAEGGSIAVAVANIADTLAAAGAVIYEVVGN